MTYRKLRIAWSVGWGLLCVLLAALWVRSYWRDDFVKSMNDVVNLVCGSNMGELEIQIWRPTTPFTYPVLSLRLFKRTTMFESYAAELCAENVGSPSIGFSAANVYDIWFPHWFAATVTAIFSAMPWPPWSEHFSLRTLLIAITLVAVGLGAIAMMLRGS